MSKQVIYRSQNQFIFFRRLILEHQYYGYYLYLLFY